MRVCEIRELVGAWLPCPAGYSAYNRGKATLVDQFGRNECTLFGERDWFWEF